MRERINGWVIGYIVNIVNVYISRCRAQVFSRKALYSVERSCKNNFQSGLLLNVLKVQL